MRYHLGDLDPKERAAVEKRLESDAEFARRSAEIADCLAASQADQAPADTPPSGLADRTCHAVVARATEDVARCAGRKRFSLVELGAVSVAALMLGALIVPAIQASRDRSRRIDCENNLGELYRALQSYSNDHGSRFPEIGLGQNAGLFSVALADGGYLERESLQERLLCPSSQLAQEVADRRAAVVVPTRRDLLFMPPLLRDRLQRLMAGSFAYRIGYFSDGRYVYPKNRTNCRSALLADAPRRDCRGAVVSNNHGGCGQNVLYEDGHVKFQSCWSPGAGDHLFLNDDNEIAAGRGPRDIVLAPSESKPGSIRIVRFRL